MKELAFLLTGMVIGAVLHSQSRRTQDAEAIARQLSARGAQPRSKAE